MKEIISPSRYMSLGQEQRDVIKQKAKARYDSNPEKAKRRIYLHMLQTNFIKRPKQRTLEQYDIKFDPETSKYL